MFDIFFFVIVLFFIYKIIVLELFFLDFFNLNIMEIVYIMVKERLEGMSSENVLLVELLRSFVVVYMVKR